MKSNIFSIYVESETLVMMYEAQIKSIKGQIEAVVKRCAPSKVKAFQYDKVSVQNLYSTSDEEDILTLLDLTSKLEMKQMLLKEEQDCFEKICNAFDRMKRRLKSDRTLEVFLLARKGLDNFEIAEEVKITYETVCNYKTKINQQLSLGK
jgi:DNA-binding NarL/FixJ family response regulator